MRYRCQKGQAVLIVLLSLSVVLVVVMYILSRSVTDISLSIKDENAMRAFSAAEAGIERALVAGSTGSQEIGGAGFEASVTDFAAGQTYVTYPISLKSGELATFWFVEHDDNGNLTCVASSCFTGDQIVLRWGDEGTSDSAANTPAIELTVYYSNLVGNSPDLTTLKVARATYDTFSSRRLNDNKFLAAYSGVQVIGTDRFQFHRTVNFEDNLGIPNTALVQPIYATVKMLYNTTPHKIALSVTGGTLPSQGSVIDSTGTYGDSNRRISVYQLYPVVPSIFGNALYSGTGIVQ